MSIDVFQYFRFSVGGMTDVAEIKGHRYDLDSNTIYSLYTPLRAYWHLVLHLSCAVRCTEIPAIDGVGWFNHESHRQTKLIFEIVDVSLANYVKISFQVLSTFMKLSLLRWLRNLRTQVQEKPAHKNLRQIRTCRLKFQLFVP